MPKSNSEAVNLTDRYVRSLKVGDGERLEVWDAECRGLCIRVSGTGKRWAFRYRRPDGSQPRLTIGDYVPPEEAADNARALTVSGARSRARRLRTEIEDGGDPAGEKRVARAEAQAQPIRTVNHLAAEYFAACERGEYRPNKRRSQKRAATLTNERWMYAKHLAPAFGEVRVESLTRDAVKKALRVLLDDGKGVMANRVRSLLQRIYTWANVERRTTINPAAEIEPMAEEKPRTRVMSDDEFTLLWSAFKDPSGLRLPPAKGEKVGRPVYVGRPVRIALQLAFLTLQRRAEIAGMRVDEVDLDRGVWRILPERTKNGRGQTVPLGSAAVALIREAIAVAEAERVGKGDAAPSQPSPFVFPGRNDPQVSAIDPGALSHALADVRAGAGVADVTVHDARRLGATLLCGERIGVSVYTVGLVLNHASERSGASAVTLAHYIHSDTLPEKKRALVALERLLLEIAGEVEPSAKVVSLTGAAA